MVTARQFCHAFNAWVEDHPDLASGPMPIFRKERNAWMRSIGIGGIMQGGKRSRTIPPWWADDSEFWFVDEIRRAEFFDKYCP